MNRKARNLELQLQVAEALYQIDSLGIFLSYLAEVVFEEGSKEAFAFEQCGNMISERAIDLMDWMDKAAFD